MAGATATTHPVVVSPEIEELLVTGESETVEFKKRLPDARNVAKLVVAFANTRGGTLIIGVDDAGEPIGLSEDDAVLAYHALTEVAAAYSILRTSAGIVSVRGRTVVHMDVHPAPPNVAPVSTAAGEFFVRRGKAVIAGNPEELFRSARADARTQAQAVEGQARGAAARKRRKPRRGPVVLFVAMSFAFEDEPALVDYFEAIVRVARSARRKVELRRVDQVEGDYEISQKIMDLIRDSDIVLTDFTRSPHNVYFEAGYARGCGKPLIQTARNGTQLQFDVKSWRTLFFKNATELEKKLAGELDALLETLGGRGRSRAGRTKKRIRSPGR